MLAAIAVLLFGTCVAETTYILTLHHVATGMSRRARERDDFGSGFSVMSRSELRDMIEGESKKATPKGKPPAGHSGLYL